MNLTDLQNKIIGLVDVEIQKDFRLFPAIYESQKDNIFDGSITCAITSLSMLLQSLNQFYNLPNGSQTHEEDKILKDIRANLKTYIAQAGTLGLGINSEQGLRENFYFLQWYAKNKYNVNLKVEALSREKLFDKIRNTSAPFVSNTSHMLTKCGHVNLFRGWCKDDSGEYTINNDPYGSWPYKASISGEAVKYPFANFPDKWIDANGKPDHATYITLST